MKRFPTIAGLTPFFLLFLLLLSLVGLGTGCSSLNRVQIDVLGSSKSYSVMIQESIGNEFPLFFSCSVWANIEKEKTFIGSAPLIAFDDNDCSLVRRYNKGQWTADNIFRLISTSESDRKETLRIVNWSQRRIKLLRVNSGDISLIIDIEPRDTVIVESRHLSGNRYVSVYAVLESNLKLVREVNLQSITSDDMPVILINLREDDVEISSPNYNSL